MQKKRPPLSLIFAGAAAAAATVASAASFGPGGSGAMLGQPLDFTVQLRLDPGETVSADCVSAEVTVGERRLTAGAVRTGVEQLGPELARLRVRTTQVVDEPVVGIDLTAGCNARLSRRFVVLADPPLNAPPAVTVAVTPAYAANLPDATAGSGPSASVATPAAGGDLPRVAEPLPATVSSGAATAGDAAPPAPRPRAAASPPTGRASTRSDRRPVEVRSGERRVADRTPAPRAAAEATGAAPAPQRAEAPRARPAQSTPAPVTQPAATPAVVAQPAVPPPQAVPRLKLDVPEPAAAAATVASADAAVIEQALAAVAQATSATRASASAAAASAERIAALERTVEQLRSQASNGRDLAVQRDRASRADGNDGVGGNGPNRWLWLLLASVVLLAVMVAWLAWRLLALQRDRQTGWRGASGANSRVDMQLYDPPSGRQPTAPIPFMTSRIKAAPDSEVMSPRGPPAWPPAAKPAVSQARSTPASVTNMGDTIQMAPHEMAAAVEAFRPDMAMQRTEALPSLLGPDDGAPRDVSIEELIDLEQQAEFFVVLGQDDAAADLLVEHLRHTGGGSPLPYLKLLEIYRRRGDRTDYERMRERFNHRFNAYAPEWDADLQGGRTLEDYPGVIPRLQQVWNRPLDAMAELEALLFRKSRGELFDLPAYRDVLFLYSLARDLLDREAADTGNVDLLLPMADGGEFSSTSPAPYLSLETDKRFEPLEFEDLPTAPVDLDLTADSERQTSIFDPLDDTPQGPRSRR